MLILANMGIKCKQKCTTVILDVKYGDTHVGTFVGGLEVGVNES